METQTRLSRHNKFISGNITILSAEGSSLYQIVLHTVTANSLKSQNGTLFSHVWRRGRLALDPL